MQKCHHLGALALLGALMLYLFLWPICCCAAKPTWSPQQHKSLSTEAYLEVPTSSIDNMSTNNSFVDLLNASSANVDNETMLHVGNSTENENVLKDHEQPTTSIYELFALGKSKKRRASSDQTQILSRTDRSVHLNSSNSKNNSVSGTKRVKNNKTKSTTLDRNERSANLSHIAGSARKIQLYIKNRFLQLLPDGTVNGTTEDTSDYTILQRTTVNVGQIKIQGVATCLFLCMNSCGATYGSAEFTDDCIFNESMEQHHYNTYSSTYHSNAKRKLYLGLNRHGQPRKIQLPTTRPLGKLATYTKSLTQTVAHERVDALIARLFGANHVRHGLKQLCDTGNVLGEIIANGLKGKPKCSNSVKPNKKKKKKRKCREDEAEGENCIKAISSSISGQQGNTKLQINNSINASSKKKVSNPNPNAAQNKKCTTEDCKVNKKRRNNQQKPILNGNNNNNNAKGPKGKKKQTTKITTTPKPEDEEELDGKFEALTSDEIELEDGEYDEPNSSHGRGETSNLVDDENEYAN